MDNFTNELLNAIEEIALNTGLSVNECIYQAKKMLREEIKRRKREEYAKQLANEMFRNWKEVSR